MANLPGGFLILAEPSSPLGNLECETSCVKFSSHPVGEASLPLLEGGREVLHLRHTLTLLESYDPDQAVMPQGL